MFIQELVFSLVILLLSSLVAEPLARALRLPFAAVLVVFGYLGSELIVALGYDTGIRASSFSTLIFYVFLPIIIFESAYRIDQKQLRMMLYPIVVLAVPIMMISTALVALAVYWGIGHQVGFPIYTALVAGALLAATDPLAVVSHLRKLDSPQQLSMLLEGESLFNDAIAVVLFTTFLGMALSMTQGDVEADFIGLTSEGVIYFCRMFLGGIVFGVVSGLLGTVLSYLIKTRVLESISLIAIAYGSFLIAEDFLGVSGVMAVLSAGLVMSKAHARYLELGDRKYINYWWEVLSYLSNAMVFLLVGVTITFEMFEHRWLAMIIAVLAVLVVRALGTFVLLPLFSLGRKTKVDSRSRCVLFWGGTRGAVTVALALSLPTELEAWWTIQSMAFGVLIFTLFVQAPTVPLLVRLLYPKKD